MYDELLAKVAERKHGYEEALQPPCGAAAISSLRRDVISNLECTLPDEYCRFLAFTNGLDWNGLVVYGSERAPIVGYKDRFIEGFVQANLDLRESGLLNDRLVFAEDGVALYTLLLSSMTYEAITNVGHTRLESFVTFDELLFNALSSHTS